ncbi:MAG TPA: hypothetical protein VJB70_01565 [Candidatus Paceibacterota bacterium]
MTDSSSKEYYEKRFVHACKVATGNGHILGEAEYRSVSLDDGTHVPDIYQEVCSCTRKGCGAFVGIHRSDGADQNLGKAGDPVWVYWSPPSRHRCGIQVGELLRSSQEDIPTLH